MKKTTFILSIITFSVLYFSSCTKSSPQDTEYKPTEASFNKLMDAGYKSLIQTATFDASNTNFTFTSSKGTTVTIDGSCLRKNGATVNGTVTLEFFEAFNRSDMVIANMPTMGKNSQGEYEPLLSGGQFSIFAKQDGVELTSACGIKVSTPNANLPSDMSNMSAWDGKIVNGKLIWETATTWETVWNAHKGLTFTIPGFGRFNCDKFYSDPRPKTKITVQVPTGYSQTSSQAMLIKSIPNSMGGLYGEFPVGLECYLMFVTEKNGQYQWIIKETTLVSNHTIQFDLKDATLGSKSDYENAIKALN